MRVFSGCRFWGRQLSLIVPAIVYDEKRERPSELVTVCCDNYPWLKCGAEARHFSCTTKIPTQGQERALNGAPGRVLYRTQVIPG